MTDSTRSRARRGGIATLVLLAATTTAPPASAGADFADPSAGFVDQTDEDGQRVVFKDDPMSADTLGSNGAVIVLRPSAARVGLLRPRLEFIQAMLKSVEDL